LHRKHLAESDEKPRGCTAKKQREAFAIHLGQETPHMTRYERVQQILDESIGGPDAQIGVHGAFWRGTTRAEFIAMQVRNRQLLIIGDGAGSNLVKALKGEAPFGADLEEPPPGATLSRMPAGFDPVTPEHIAFIQQWIDDGCPEDLFMPAPTLRWRPTNAPVASSRTDDIWFLNPMVGWAVNSNGSIVHTTDGFNTFEVQFQDIPPIGLEPIYFRCLAFATPTHGWAGTLTASKTLFETQDGHTWTQVANLPALAPSAICGMHAVNDQVVYASGTNYPNRPPRMMKTMDGGQTWTAWSMKTWADLLIDCYFTSPSRGWVVGGKTDLPNPTRLNVKPVVLLTEDGGQTWVNRVANMQDQFPPGEWGWKIQFLNDQIGFVSLENFSDAAILKTTDGGQTWKRLKVNDPQGNVNLEGIGFIDEQRGWVGGWGPGGFGAESPPLGFSSATSDGGEHWQDANEIGLFINRFRFLGNPAHVGYASGDTVYKYSSELIPPAMAALAVRPQRGQICNSLAPLVATDSVQFSITIPPNATRLAVYIWDRFGEFVRTLVDEANPSSGPRTLQWDRTDTSGQVLPPGMFIWRVLVDQVTESRLVQMR
jgi:photosystem II stability/assembly factor-like uncharacterized protein